MQFYGNIPQFFGEMPSQDEGILSGTVLLGTLKLSRTGLRSFIELYGNRQELPGDDQEI
jgi:hypothetical protein